MTINRLHDIEAEITFLPTELGGKTKPAWQNYRVDHDFGLSGTINSAQHEFIGRENVAPGETVMSKMWLGVPEQQNGRFYQGFKFTVQEGPQIVAHGVIIKILNEALRNGT